ncbi:MAG: hypothetical protein F4147_06695, partial [Gammaproteobacteria bacterium]|nr:hypothetical protein [Gammaproteobacteria bacterium]
MWKKSSARRDAPVDFLIVGTARAGTTTLFETLRKHPDIFIPARKECRYFSALSGEFAGPGPQFAKTVIRTPEEYRELFCQAKSGQLRGDISPEYLYYCQNAVPKILAETHEQFPIIIVLRNPIDRAYSHYLFNIRQGWESLSFEDAIKQEPLRKAENWPCGWFYVERGYYANQVKAYTDVFPRVLILLFERDVITGLAGDKILTFLGLGAQPGGKRNIHVNAGGYPKHRRLHRWLTNEDGVVRRIKNVVKKTPLYDSSLRVYQRLLEADLKKVDMKSGTRLMLKERFVEDVDLLAAQTHL